MQNSTPTQAFVAPHGGRADKIISQYLESPRNQVAQLIKSGCVKINGEPVFKSASIVDAGDAIVVTFPAMTPEEGRPVDFDVPVLYEDDDILVVNKPAPLVVHPAPSVKEPTLVDWLRHKGISLSTLSGEERHGIVHRIDKETSGALVVAKNNAAHLKLSEQLQDKTMGRYYLAMIDYPLKEHRIVERSVGRDPANRLRMGVVAGGRSAKTAFVKLLEDPISHRELVAAKLYTGRTHQIRVHLASVGRHILGDSLYGFKSPKTKIKRMFLHAYILYLKHPKTDRTVYFRAPLPEELYHGLKAYFTEEELNAVLDENSFIHHFDRFPD